MLFPVVCFTAKVKELAFECDLNLNSPQTEDFCKNVETISYYTGRVQDSVNITEGQGEIYGKI